MEKVKQPCINSACNFANLTDEFFDIIEFTLIKYRNSNGEIHWGLEDRQVANLGDIQSDRFANASEIFERLDRYIEDYFVDNLLSEAESLGYDLSDFDDWADLVSKAKSVEALAECKGDINILDMICNHADEVNLDECCYEEAEEWK